MKYRQRSHPLVSGSSVPAAKNACHIDQNGLADKEIIVNDNTKHGKSKMRLVLCHNLVVESPLSYLRQRVNEEICSSKWFTCESEDDYLSLEHTNIYAMVKMKNERKY